MSSDRLTDDEHGWNVAGDIAQALGATRIADQS
jgi:hypothetical protein